MFLHGDILHLTLQHAVPVGVRRQRRGRHGAHQISGLLSRLRRRRRACARLHAAGLQAAADRRQRRGGRRDRRLSASCTRACWCGCWPSASSRSRSAAAWVLGVWVATQLIMVLVNQSDQVAWWAHIGGMVAGAVLVVFMRRPGVPLFDRGLHRSLNSGYSGSRTGPVRPLRHNGGCPSVVQSAAPVAQLTPNCRRPTLPFRTCEASHPAVINETQNGRAQGEDRSAARPAGDWRVVPQMEPLAE